MILRALFWIAVVAVLMPHEPDLGLGKASGITAMLPTSITQLASGAASAPQQACLDNAASCAAALSVVDRLQNVAVSSLDQVRVELEQARAERQQQHMAYND